MRMDFKTHIITIMADDIINWCNNASINIPPNTYIHCPIKIRFCEDTDNCSLCFPDRTLKYIHTDYLSDTDINNATIEWLYEKSIIDKQLTKLLKGIV